MFGLKKINDIDGEKCDLYLGLPGTGKTLTIVEDVILPALLSGVQVYSNFWINWNLPNFHYYTNFKEEVVNVRNCLVIIDEIGSVLPPRDWESESQDIREFFMLHRHRCVDIVYNTQNISLVAKTAFIQTDRFFMCEKNHLQRIIKFFYRKFDRIGVKIHNMTINEIKLLDKPNFADNDDQQYKSMSVDSYWYKISKMHHFELDDRKVELIHMYCPECRHRQGIQILKDDTDVYADLNGEPEADGSICKRVQLDKCPKHPTVELTLRYSTMYDSHYEPERIEQAVTWKPFIMAPKLTPFRGSISPSMLKDRDVLSKKLKK